MVEGDVKNSRITEFHLSVTSRIWDPPLHVTHSHRIWGAMSFRVQRLVLVFILSFLIQLYYSNVNTQPPSNLRIFVLHRLLNTCIVFLFLVWSYYSLYCLLIPCIVFFFLVLSSYSLFCLLIPCFVFLFLVLSSHSLYCLSSYSLFLFRPRKRKPD